MGNENLFLKVVHTREFELIDELYKQLLKFRVVVASEGHFDSLLPKIKLDSALDFLGLVLLNFRAVEAELLAVVLDLRKSLSGVEPK